MHNLSDLFGGCVFFASKLELHVSEAVAVKVGRWIDNNGTHVHPCSGIFPYVAINRSLLSLALLLRSVGAFPKMATSTEMQAKECGGRSPLQIVGPNKIAVSGLWLVPGSDTMPICFFAHAEKDTGRVIHGPALDGVETHTPENERCGAGYQVWVPLTTGASFGLAVGFHHSNTTTSLLKSHWLLPAGCGVWRTADQLITFVLHEVHTHSSVPATLTHDLKPYGSMEEFQDCTGIEFETDRTKTLLKWFSPIKPIAYVSLRDDYSVQYCNEGVRTPGDPNGTWTYYKESNGSEFLMTWFHWSGKRTIDGLPQAEATVLQQETEESSVMHHVPVWRAVGTLTSGVENFIVEKFVGAAAKTMRSWHVFVQIVWQSQM